jgi:hypothetical protein
MRVPLDRAGYLEGKLATMLIVSTRGGPLKQGVEGRDRLIEQPAGIIAPLRSDPAFRFRQQK